MAERIRLNRQATRNNQSSPLSRVSLQHQTSNAVQLQSSPAQRLNLIQKKVGNSSMQRLASSGVLQAKLKIGKANNKYEKEADSVAGKVIKMPLSQPSQSLQKKEDEDVQQKPLAATITPLVQRKEEEEAQEKPLIQKAEEEEETQGKFLVQKAEEEEPQQKSIIQKVEEEETQEKPLIQRAPEEDEAQAKLQIQKAAEEEEPQGKLLVQKAEEEEPQQKQLVQKAEEEDPQGKLQIQKAEEEEAQEKPLLQKADEEEAQGKFTLQRAEEEEAQGKLQIQKAEEEEAQEKSLLQKAEDEEPQGKFFTQKADKEDELQVKAGSNLHQMDDNLSNRIQAKKGSGRPMPMGIQTPMEDRFGTDFGNVRLHTDAEAADLNKSVGARAFTLKNNIYFGAGEYNQDTSRGQELLAHELTHTVQQGATKKPNQKDAESSPSTKPAADAKAAIPESPKLDKEELPIAGPPAKTSAPKDQPVIAGTPTKASEVKAEVKKAPAPEIEKETKKEEPAKTEEKPPAAMPAAEKPKKNKVKKAVRDPKKDPAFQSVARGVGAAGKTLKQHEPATAKATQAQEAALGPEDEVEGQAQANQVDEMEAAKPKGFDKKAFKAALIERIRAIAPKNMVETLTFKYSGKLEAAKQTMSSQVKQGKEQSASDITGKAEAEPQKEGINPKVVVPLKPEKEIPTPQIPGQEGAAPKKRNEGEISLEEESNSLDQKMEEANVTEEQLEKSNEPEFQQALESKRSAQESAKQAPKKFRGQEKGLLNDSTNIATSNIAKDIGAMQNQRTQTGIKVTGKQVGGKGKDETERGRVTKDIKNIYKQTKTEVETILTGLDTKVTTQFDSGATEAQQIFENYVNDKMYAYKKDRYSGISGGIAWAWDKLTGMPDEVNVFYSDGRVIFLAAMDRVIDNVTNTIADELKKAAEAIKRGKKLIADYVKNLPKNLKKFGTEAADEIQNEFDDLEGQIASKQDELINTLAQKYVESVKKVDSRIKKMKEANRGLIAKAFDFIVGIIKAIIEIGKKLLSLLKKIASVVMDIISDPIGFLGNLIDAIKLGFSNFAANIWDHLKKGVIIWLTGSMGEANIEIPKKFDLMGIFKLVMSILGLTWDYIRTKAVKMFGEPVVKAMEKAAEVFMVIKKEGISGLWKYLKKQFTDLKKVVLDAIKEMIITEVIKAGVKWLLGLFNPAGAFIKAAMMIYEVVKFFIQNAARIIDLINAIFDAIGAIAKGSIKSAAKMVENALAKAIPLIIGFLASLLGISGLVKKVQNIIKRIRKRIDRAITKLLKKVRKTFKGIFKKTGKFIGTVKQKGKKVVVGAKEKGKAAIVKIIQWWKRRKRVKTAGKTIDIFFEIKGKNIDLVVKASPKRGYISYLNTLEGVDKSDPDYKAAVGLGQQLDKTQMPSKKRDITKSDANKITKKLNQFANLIKKLNEKAGGEVPMSVIRFGSLDKYQGGTAMNAEILGPKHPKGSPVRDMPPIMKNLGKLGKSPGRRPYYVQGHLLNNNLGGPGKRWNLTPITKAANSQHSRDIEEPLKTHVNKNKLVAVYGVKVMTGSHSKRKGYNTLDKIVNNETYLVKAGPLASQLIEEHKIMTAELKLSKGFSVKTHALEKDNSGKWTKKKPVPGIRAYTVSSETGGDQGLPIRDFDNRNIESIYQDVSSN